MSQQPPMTPTGNSAAQYQSSFRVSMPDRNSLASPMTRQGPPQATPASAGNAYKTPARALRDISNTYTDMTPAQGYSKVPPPNAKPSSTLDIASSALMTPPSSSSVRRTGAPGNPRSMHTMSPTSMQSTPTAQPATSRPLQPPPPPPVFGHGHYPSNASPLANEIIMPRLGLPNHSAASSPWPCQLPHVGCCIGDKPAGTQLQRQHRVYFTINTEPLALSVHGVPTPRVLWQ
ncbi:hypothetical protein DL89DRAFT_169665 [Linderina pennispora]|uniref:Uncharacterized protein n=1 Tax=Linderina pennispora TaxID=61395 RepID=A0A1Y1W6I9_9FUNG|nr:uncharacterized protein DL89DRAFT_169665 [Linderina pennispora]ORX69032.1 hypothetical protein DL89DRAFT_169665 [Linderina pennispora]